MRNLTVGNFSRQSLGEALQLGRVSHADVPYQAPWYGSVLRPLLVLTNILTALWIYPCWRTVHIRWMPGAAALLRLTQSTGRPLIYYSWHAYSALLVYLFLDADIPRGLVPIVIGHDGFKSQVVQRALAWFGWHVWFYRRHSPVPPKEQIIQLIRTTGSHVCLLADSGGPYGRVKPGLLEVAQATGALLVPIVASGRAILKLERPRRYRVPFPFCSLSFHYAEPLDGRTASVQQCQEALDALESSLSP